MKINVVPPAHVPARWHEVEQYLASALEHSQGDYALEHVRVYLSDGAWMLAVAEDEKGIHGAAAVHFFNRPTTRVAFVVAAGGYLIMDADTMVNFRALCKGFGATHIECAARESTARLFRRIGYAEKYRIMEVPV